MLDPEYLAGLPEAVLRLWREAELEILKDMARRISEYDFWIPAADYQNERLLAAGRTQTEILSVLARATKRSEPELRQMMIEAGSRCLREDAAVYTAAGLTPPAIRDSKELTAILNEGYKATAQTMKNLTRTTARTATLQFENALDTAWLQVSSGAFDADSAIRQAVKQLSGQGIETVRYPKSGHVDTVETAVRRAVLTGVNQTAARLQEELADELGCDLVEVSAHAGARPEHAEWQGNIYSRSGKSEKYPDFRSSTGYGTGAGLCGWNCRHTFGPYIEGSPRVWTDEKLAELNAPKYEYNGEKLTEYEARQKEKYFDRQIHRWNREAEAMKAAGQDSAEARAKVKEWTAKKRDFLQNRVDLPLAKAQKGGIINAVSNALTPVTGASIRNLKVPDIPGFSMETCRRFYEAEKELLQEVQKLEVGTEVAKICRLDGTVEDTIVGTAGGGAVKIPPIPYKHFLLHNHPDNRTLSGQDIERFIISDTMTGMCALGNNGSNYYSIFKRTDYDGMLLYRAFAEASAQLDMAVEKQNIDLYIETVSTFLEGIGKYGVDFVKN